MTLDRDKWYPFDELMSSPEIDKHADERSGDMSGPDWMNRFISLTAICAMVVPEADVGEDFCASDGTVVFLQKLELGDDVQTKAWTLTITVGGSTTFVFAQADWGSAYVGDDSEPLNPQILQLLSRSYWRPLNYGSGLV
jgi:hypothetical protein